MQRRAIHPDGLHPLAYTGPQEFMAAVCLMMQFATMDRAKYDGVMKALDWQNTGSPKGLISHMAGPMQQGWGVVDVWESQADFDRFLETHLRRAFEQARARFLFLHSAQRVSCRKQIICGSPQIEFELRPMRRIGACIKQYQTAPRVADVHEGRCEHGQGNGGAVAAIYNVALDAGARQIIGYGVERNRARSG
jgi:hypothetical protein